VWKVEKTITIRVDEELYKKIKVEVATRGTTLKDYILNLIEQDMNSKK
jgi:predicted DNA binding CopG/RHH family protein